MKNEDSRGYITVVHPIEPVYDANSRALILGSLPSAASRERRFYYGHPQNRFWRVIAAVCGEEVPVSDEEKKRLLLRHGIALYDTVYRCDITGSSDSSIKNVVPTDPGPIVRSSRIKSVFCNGAAAGRFYERYHRSQLGIPAVTLPSTSPANAAWSLPRLVDVWSAALGSEILL